MTDAASSDEPASLGHRRQPAVPTGQVVDVFTLPGPDLLQESGPSMTTRGRYDLIAAATVAAVGLLVLRRRVFATDDNPAQLP